MTDRRSFYRNCQTVKFSKGETIFDQDEIPKCLYSVKSGVIEETNISSNGNHQLISFEIIGDIVPKCWAFSKTTSTLFYYTAYTDCELYVIKKEDFLEQLADNIDFTNKMLKRTVSALIGARLQIDSLEKPTAALKLLYMFRHFCLLYGEDTKTNITKLQVPLTQQKIADHLGLTRETTNIELNKLKASKIINIYHKIYSIDTEKLDQKIEDEYNPGISVNMLPHAVDRRKAKR